MRLDPTSHTDLMTELRDLKLRLHALETEKGLNRTEAVMLPAQSTFVGPYLTITSASMVAAWERRLLDLSASSLYVRVTVSGDSGTSGAIQLSAQGDLSDSQAIPASSSAVYYWRWTPDPAIWPLGSNLLLQLQAQRLTGSNNINVYPPALLVASSEELEPIVSGGIASS